MAKHNSFCRHIPVLTIGLDVSDRSLRYCQMDAGGEIAGEGELRLQREELRRFMAAQPAGTRVAMETGVHAMWLQEEIRAAGHEVIVGNARALPAVTGGLRRSDRIDAQQIARLARVDPKLLRPVELRSSESQADLSVLRGRANLVEARTQLINMARGTAKTMGHRLPDCSSHRFDVRAPEAVPACLKAALLPVLTAVATINQQIAAYDQQIEELAEQRYPQTRWLRQVPGVGTLTALTFVLTLGDPARFAHSRDVGAFLGLVPRRRQSGEQDPHMHITKGGDAYLRRLLVQCAHVLLSRQGQDCALRRWALARTQSGKSAKKRIVVAVSRKLAVLLHRLWMQEERFVPFPEGNLGLPV